jgi:hypothetical protein
MRVVTECGDEVRGDAHDDEGAEPVHNMVGSEKRTMQLVRADSGRAVVGIRSRGDGHHLDMLESLVIEEELEV